MTPEPLSPSHDPRADDDRSWLSALADGDSQALDRACAHWQADEAARGTWHAYHLIGDVMRSDELARPAARDAAFLAGVRARLAAEPVVLAPAPVAVAPAEPARRRQVWLVPAAAAAGFAVVAGALVVSRVGTPVSQPVYAAASGPAAVRVPGAAITREAAYIRDPRLDEYMRVHRLVGGGLPGGAPTGELRPVDNQVAAEPRR